MRHEPFELMDYTNKELMNELNELFINIKVWMYEEAAKLRSQRPKPTVEELDDIFLRVHRALSKDARPMIRR